MVQERTLQYASAIVAMPQRERELNGLAAKLLLSCDSAATVETLGRRFKRSHPPRLNQRNCFARDRLMLEDENQFLGLPVFRQRLVNATTPVKCLHHCKPSTTDPLLRVV